jgi:hypothetical protein
MRGTFDNILAQKLKNLLLEKPNLINGPEPVGCIIERNRSILNKAPDLWNQPLSSIIDTKIHTVNLLKKSTFWSKNTETAPLTALKTSNIAHFVPRGNSNY